MKENLGCWKGGAIELNPRFAGRSSKAPVARTFNLLIR